MKKELIAVLAVSMLSGAAFAMDGSMKSKDKMSSMSSFESLDTDGNGQVSRSEWDAGKSSMDAMGHSSDSMGSSSGGRTPGDAVNQADDMSSDDSVLGRENRSELSGSGNLDNEPAQ